MSNYFDRLFVMSGTCVQHKCSLDNMCFVCIVFHCERCGGFMCVLFCKIKVAGLLR